MNDVLSELRFKNLERSREWGLDAMSHREKILFQCTELAGEAGELCNAVKKLARYQHGMPGGVDHPNSCRDISDELGDVIIAADMLARSMGLVWVSRLLRSLTRRVTSTGLSQR